MEGAVEACLEIAQQGVEPAELRQVAGVLPTGDDGLMAATPVETDRKQASPSESTWLPGARWCLAQSAIASELKPLTAAASLFVV